MLNRDNDKESQMNRSMRRKLLLILVMFAITFGYAYSSQEFNQTVIISDSINEDLYTAGQSVSVTARINGDITAAAQRISIEEAVEGDVNVAAEVITISAPIADDIRAAGRLISISAAVGDHIVAAGETITIGTKASTQGWVKLAARHVEVLGNIGNDLVAAGQHVIIGGEIHGNARITADTIVILSSAKISGKLIYRSPNKPDIQPGAKIDGAVEQLPMPDAESVSTAAVKAVFGVLLVFGLALILAGIVYYLVFPHFSLLSARTISEQPLQAIGLGVVVLIILPFIIILLFMTIIGYLLALCILAVYLVVLLVGMLTGMFYFTDLVLRRAFKQVESSKVKYILTFIITSLVLTIILFIPVLGALLLLFMLVAGNGAVQIQLWRRYSAAKI
jgi:cytoskeletal protein CcmA (bactofilin family)